MTENNNRPRTRAYIAEEEKEKKRQRLQPMPSVHAMVTRSKQPILSPLMPDLPLVPAENEDNVADNVEHANNVDHDGYMTDSSSDSSIASTLAYSYSETYSTADTLLESPS
jgi:hypothetical protein